MQSKKLILFFYLSLTLFPFFAYASGIRDKINWRTTDGKSGTARCHDGGKTCVDSGEKIIGGIRVFKSCWKWGYTKTCDFPTKNDCHLIAHCYEVGLKECLMHDQIGNCVNQKKEFSCKRREMFTQDKAKLKQKLKGDEAKKIVCKGIPCIDGNCLDKSYDMDEDMMNSASKLYAVSQAKGAKDMNFKLFEGFDQHCTKKPVGYMSCCKVKGWGSHLGASCNADEVKLQNLRERNLCVYVGKSTSGTKPAHINKHHFCCFGNMLNKVIQVEGRKQLGMDFGEGGHPNCRGLTLEEITRLDFEKMDFSEFIVEIKKKMKVPNVGDIHMRASSSVASIDDNSKGMNDRLKKELGNDCEY